MKESGIGCYVVSQGDYHNSEYVSDHFKARTFVSGFTGSNGTLVVTEEEAGLWTDGRYFLQAARQLEGSGIDLRKMGEPGVPTIPEYIRSLAENGDPKLGFDGSTVSLLDGESYEEAAGSAADIDLVSGIWKERPALAASGIFSLPDEVTGYSVLMKFASVRAYMQEEGADLLLITDLTEIAWLLNLRGRDIPGTPVFFAFLLVGQESAELFVLNREAFERDFAGDLPFVTVRDYMDVFACVRDLPAERSIWVDPGSVNYRLAKDLPEGMQVIRKPSPVSLLKAVKNSGEISSTLKAHIIDGCIMVKFLHDAKTRVGHVPATEMSAAAYLDGLRLANEHCFDLSFDTISGYQENGAVIHYKATPETDKRIEPYGFLLVDSGGQYDLGTTDITRTIVLGPLTRKMKEYYTYVLKSHIALADCEFDPGTGGLELDAVARKPLLAAGLDFNHGTGHGVGHILSVHEGPVSISKRATDLPFAPGMITSDEPGVYIEGEFGIRLENELLTVEKEDGSLAFLPITFCPFDREAILPELMTEAELEWLNAYHEDVYRNLSEHLDEELREWLEEQTAPIG